MVLGSLRRRLFSWTVTFQRELSVLGRVENSVCSSQVCFSRIFLWRFFLQQISSFKSLKSSPWASFTRNQRENVPRGNNLLSCSLAPTFLGREASHSSTKYLPNPALNARQHDSVFKDTSKFLKKRRTHGTCWWFRNPSNQRGCIKTLQNCGINYQAQVVSQISATSTVWLDWLDISSRWLS